MQNAFPNGHFNIIYADPPWRWRTFGIGRKPGSGERWAHRKGLPPYPVMNTASICRLPVSDLAANSSVLFLWATYPMLPAALEVVRSWGFEYKTVAFTWVKQNPSGKGFHFGMGYWTRANPEICLLATRGKPRRVGRAVPNLIIAPRRDHSRKPDTVRQRIVDLCGDLPRIELFARDLADGWSAWGDELPN